MACCCTTWAVLAVVGFIAYKILKPKLFPPRPSPFKQDWQKDKVYVYQFPRTRVAPSLSPYCLKLETWLRMANIDYENVDCGYMMRSKEGTLPFVELNGVEYPDSGLIIRDFTRLFKKQSLSGHDDDSCQGVARAIEKMVEGSLIQSYAYHRYALPAGQVAKQMDDSIFPNVPKYLQVLFNLASPLVNRSAKKRSAASGIGKHPSHDIEWIGHEDIKALTKCLGEKDFFLGEKPTTVDAAVFAVLAVMLYTPLSSPQKTSLLTDESKNLKDFCERIKTKFWPDWNEVTGQSCKLNTNWRQALKRD